MFYRRWFVCVSVCLSMTTITKKIVDGFLPYAIWESFEIAISGIEDPGETWLKSTSTYMYSVPYDSLLQEAPPCALRHWSCSRDTAIHVQFRLQFFSFRVTNRWNHLPAVSASSLNAFKGKLDKFWDNCQYSLESETFSRYWLLISQKVVLA